MANGNVFNLGGIGGDSAFGSTDSLRSLGGLIGEMIAPLSPAAREESEAQAKVQLQRLRDLMKQVKQEAAMRAEARAKATIEALLVSAGMTGHFCEIDVLGVDAFELVCDDEEDITLGELNLIARTFKTTAVTVDWEYRSAKDPECSSSREFCNTCSDYHAVESPVDPDYKHWQGDRLVITVRGVGIDLQSLVA